jgi:hypothetical protein
MMSDSPLVEIVMGFNSDRCITGDREKPVAETEAVEDGLPMSGGFL